MYDNIIRLYCVPKNFRLSPAVCMSMIIQVYHCLFILYTKYMMMGWIENRMFMLTVSNGA
jgi:hypothetical protein